MQSSKEGRGRGEWGWGPGVPASAVGVVDLSDPNNSVPSVSFCLLLHPTSSLVATRSSWAVTPLRGGEGLRGLFSKDSWDFLWDLVGPLPWKCHFESGVGGPRPSSRTDGNPSLPPTPAHSPPLFLSSVLPTPVDLKSPEFTGVPLSGVSFGSRTRREEGSEGRTVDGNPGTCVRDT